MPIEGVTYCFLFVADSHPREIRRSMLEALCFVARGKCPQNQKVIGITTEKTIAQENSDDVLLLELPDQTPEHQKQMEEIQAKTGILTAARETPHHEEEYPQ